MLENLINYPQYGYTQTHFTRKRENYEPSVTVSDIFVILSDSILG